MGDAKVAFHVHAVIGGTPGYRDLIATKTPRRMADFGRWLEHSILWLLPSTYSNERIVWLFLMAAPDGPIPALDQADLYAPKRLMKDPASRWSTQGRRLALVAVVAGSQHVPASAASPASRYLNRARSSSSPQSLPARNSLTR